MQFLGEFLGIVPNHHSIHPPRSNNVSASDSPLDGMAARLREKDKKQQLAICLEIKTVNKPLGGLFELELDRIIAEVLYKYSQPGEIKIKTEFSEVSLFLSPSQKETVKALFPKLAKAVFEFNQCHDAVIAMALSMHPMDKERYPMDKERYFVEEKMNGHKMGLFLTYAKDEASKSKEILYLGEVNQRDKPDFSSLTLPQQRPPSSIANLILPAPASPGWEEDMLLGFDEPPQTPIRNSINCYPTRKTSSAPGSLSALDARKPNTSNDQRRLVNSAPPTSRVTALPKEVSVGEDMLLGFDKPILQQTPPPVNPTPSKPSVNVFPKWTLIQEYALLGLTNTDLNQTDETIVTKCRDYYQKDERVYSTVKGYILKPPSSEDREKRQKILLVKASELQQSHPVASNIILEYAQSIRS